MANGNTLVVRPSARTLIVYYGVSAAILMFFVLLSLLTVFDPTGRISVSLWLCPVGVLGGMAIAGFVAWIHLEMKLSAYTVTETEAVARSGLLFRQNKVVQLGSIKSISVEQGPIQRLFHVGDLILRTTSHSPLVFWDVPQPEEIKIEIWEFVKNASSESRF